MVRLTLMNDQITSDLEKLGMIPRKSLTLGDFLPVVPEEFRDSAILGLFDADGCITMSKHLNKVGNPIRQYIQIRCTEDVAYGIVAHLGIDLYCLQKHDAIPNLVIGNKSLIFKFFQRCYKDSPIWLPRKKVKFEALFK